MIQVIGASKVCFLVGEQTGGKIKTTKWAADILENHTTGTILLTVVDSAANDNHFTAKQYMNLVSFRVPLNKFMEASQKQRLEKAISESTSLLEFLIKGQNSAGWRPHGCEKLSWESCIITPNTLWLLVCSNNKDIVNNDTVYRYETARSDTPLSAVKKCFSSFNQASKQKSGSLLTLTTNAGQNKITEAADWLKKNTMGPVWINLLATTDLENTKAEILG